MALAGEPLFLRYSGGGSWLMLGESAWQGLRLLSAADGSPVPFHPEGFGIVGFAEVSRSERTILTYLPSGRLQYWEASSGNLTTELRAAPYLSGLRVSRDRRYAAGTNGSEVLLVDLVTGATRARFALAGVRSLDLSPTGDEIACVAPSDRRRARAVTLDARRGFVLPEDRAPRWKASRSHGTPGPR